LLDITQESADVPLSGSLALLFPLPNHNEGVKRMEYSSEFDVSLITDGMSQKVRASVEEERLESDHFQDGVRFFSGALLGMILSLPVWILVLLVIL
jgi:hypothetical protein